MEVIGVEVGDLLGMEPVEALGIGQVAAVREGSWGGQEAVINEALEDCVDLGMGHSERGLSQAIEVVFYGGRGGQEAEAVVILHYGEKDTGCEIELGVHGLNPSIPGFSN